MTRDHWARSLLGKPWSSEGEGPAAFSSWGLVRTIYRDRYGVALPPIGPGDLAALGASEAIRADASGWERVVGETAEGDLVMMRMIDGAWHAGVIVLTSEGPRLLHVEGHISRGVEVGSVCVEPLVALIGRGATYVEIWRRKA